RKLLQSLHNTPFWWSNKIPNDENRYKDGIDLRYRFGYEYNYDSIIIHNELDVCECSVLEMLIALAMRCEDEIMYDSSYGPRYERWFHLMLENMGLSNITNDNFDEDYVMDRVEIMLNRRYSPNGENGGLFVVETEYDLRTVEIWYQCMWYLTSLMNGGRGYEATR
ncbi:MAG: hypothetical protein K5666_00895, partial [Bacilli bacterium]|nr:hypothetical protein [Bacilli bacterium]